MWSNYGEGYVAVLEYAEAFVTDDGKVVEAAYVINFHKGLMPAFGGKEFSTLSEAKTWARVELGITHWRGFDGQFTAVPE